MSRNPPGCDLRIQKQNQSELHPAATRQRICETELVIERVMERVTERVVELVMERVMERVMRP